MTTSPLTVLDIIWLGIVFIAFRLKVDDRAYRRVEGGRPSRPTHSLKNRERDGRPAPLAADRGWSGRQGNGKGTGGTNPGEMWPT